jgi:hypothetical protein
MVCNHIELAEDVLMSHSCMTQSTAHMLMESAAETFIEMVGLEQQVG